MPDKKKTYSERFQESQDNYTPKPERIAVSRDFFPEINRLFNGVQDFMEASGAGLAVVDSPIVYAESIIYVNKETKPDIIITTAALDILNEKELKSLFGHELHHGFNQDELRSESKDFEAFSQSMSTTSFLISLVGISRFLLDKSQDSISGEIGLAASIVTVAIAGISGYMSHKSWHKREYDADEAGTKIGSAESMVSVLEKISNNHKKVQKRDGFKDNLRSKLPRLINYRHPSDKSRIKRLEQMQDRGTKSEISR